jgi:hypothetical protein
MLTVLAEASLAIAAAESAVDEGAHHTATDRLDEAELALADLRAAWPEMVAAQRAVVGPSAAELKQRIEAARRRIPRLSALSLGAAESDPDEEVEPRD